MTLKEAINLVERVDIQAMENAERRLDNMAKPLKSLGLLEQFIIQTAGIQRTDKIDVSKKCTVVMCADNGVVAQGVTQCGQEVTAIVTENLSKSETTVCHMSQIAGADVLPVDVGVATDLAGEKIVNKKVSYGTKDMTKEPAMTRAQAIEAIEVGINIAIDLKQKGYNLLATGEMGIGNTTTSAAVSSVLLGVAPETVTGRGAGLSTEGLICKINAIKRAIELHSPNQNDTIDVVAKIGGYDIAALAGLYIGGALSNIGIVMDGFISATAALVAVNLCPEVQAYIVPSHVSAEPAGRIMLDALHIKPFLNAEMRLGEGTGAVAMFGIFDMAQNIYYKMCTFDETNIEAYKPLQ